MSQHDVLAKLLIIGNSGVGKTNLLLKFTANTFVMSHITTIGIDFKSKIILIDGKKIKLQIWDTAGQERFRTITQTYYKGAEGIILAYSIDDEASFRSLQSWLKQIKEHAPQEILIILIGAKCDLSQQERKVSFEEGQKFAQKQGLKFFQVSAKNNINIENMFEYIGRQVKDRIEKRQKKVETQNQKREKLETSNWKEANLRHFKGKDCKC